MSEVPVILEATGLNKRFGAVAAANNISTKIYKNSIVGMIGTNGAGKTTFVNMITGYLKPDSGTIVFNGHDITRLKPRDITQLGICRSFQIPQLYDTLTVRENIGIGLGIVLRNARRTPLSRLPRQVPGYAGGLWDATDMLLQRFDLAAYRNRVAGVLPEGVRKLVDIVMSLVARPTVLLLDEPTSGVSADEKFSLMDRVINTVRSDDVTVLFIEHDMDIVARYAERVLAFYDGRILADGTIDAVLAQEEVRRRIVGGVEPQALRSP